MADIIRITDRRAAPRRSPQTSGQKAEILFFTGIRYERLDPNAIWPRVELPTVPQLTKRPALSASATFTPDRLPF